MTVSDDNMAELPSGDPRGVSLIGFLRRLSTRFLPEAEVAVYDPAGRSFEDIDTRADYNRVRELSRDCAH